jgi:hypothetical protein
MVSNAQLKQIHNSSFHGAQQRTHILLRLTDDFLRIGIAGIGVKPYFCKNSAALAATMRGNCGCIRSQKDSKCCAIYGSFVSHLNLWVIGVKSQHSTFGLTE